MKKVKFIANVNLLVAKNSHKNQTGMLEKLYSGTF
jgi:hypothetical protein